MKIRFHPDAMLEFDAAVEYITKNTSVALALNLRKRFTLRLHVSSTIRMHMLLCPKTLADAL